MHTNVPIYHSTSYSKISTHYQAKQDFNFSVNIIFPFLGGVSGYPNQIAMGRIYFDGPGQKLSKSPAPTPPAQKGPGPSAIKRPQYPRKKEHDFPSSPQKKRLAGVQCNSTAPLVCGSGDGIHICICKAALYTCF